MLYYTVVCTGICHGCGCTEKLIGFQLNEYNIELIEKFYNGEIDLDSIGSYIIQCKSIACFYRGGSYSIEPSKLHACDDLEICHFANEINNGVKKVIIDAYSEDIKSENHFNIEKLFNHSFASDNYSTEETIKHFQVKGSKRDIDNLTMLLGLISKLSKDGSSRKIILDVDGDGPLNLDITRTDDVKIHVPSGYGIFRPEECVTGHSTDVNFSFNGSSCKVGFNMKIGI